MDGGDMYSMSHDWLPAENSASRPVTTSDEKGHDALVHLAPYESSKFLTYCTMPVGKLLREEVRPTCIRCIALAARWED